MEVRVLRPIRVLGEFLKKKRYLRISRIRFYNESVIQGPGWNVAGICSMELLILVGILPICLILAWFILRQPFRLFFEELNLDTAREQFRAQRERLEARFVTALGVLDVSEGFRWEEAHWHNEVFWARDRQTRHLLALVGVHFDLDPFDEIPTRRLATAVFEFRKGQWRAEGKRLDEVRPDEAVGRNQRFEPVIMTQQQSRRLG